MVIEEAILFSAEFIEVPEHVTREYSDGLLCEELGKRRYATHR